MNHVIPRFVNYSAPLHLTMIRKLRLIKRKIQRAMRDISKRDIVKEIIITCKRHNEIYDSYIQHPRANANFEKLNICFDKESLDTLMI